MTIDDRFLAAFFLTSAISLECTRSIPMFAGHGDIWKWPVSMIMKNRPAIVLTRSDRDRLFGLLIASGASSSTVEFLRQEIERAEIVSEEVATSLVAIGTLVQFIDHRSHRVSEGRLTVPNDVETSHAISVLSPLGSALLGLGLGQTIDWNDDTGQNHRLTVVAILPPTAEA